MGNMAQGLQTDSSRIVVAGTGHRPQKLNPSPSELLGFSQDATSPARLRQDALDRIRDTHPAQRITSITGVELGFDQARLRPRSKPTCAVVEAVPFEGRESLGATAGGLPSLLDRVAAAGASCTSPRRAATARQDSDSPSGGGPAPTSSSVLTAGVRMLRPRHEYARRQGKEIATLEG